MASLTLCPIVFFYSSTLGMQGEKRGRGFPGLLDFFSPGTFWSRTFRVSRDSPVGKPTTDTQKNPKFPRFK